MSLLYSNGCSYAFGADLKDKKDGYPELIRKDLGFVSLMNSAVSSGTNDRIVRTTINEMMGLLQNEKPENMFALISMTAGARREFFRVKDNNYYQFEPTTEFEDWGPKYLDCLMLKRAYFSHFYSEAEIFDRACLQIHTLEMFFDRNKIPYLITFSLDPFQNLELDYMKTFRLLLKDRLSSPLFQSLLRKKRIFGMMHQSCREYLKSKSHSYFFKNDPKEHPNELGNKVWSEVLLKHIKENNLLEFP